MATTRKDIAEHAGVSVSTVGMILGGNGERYSVRTKRRVLEAAEKLDYRPNFAGRSLKTNRSFLIGVLTYSGNSFITGDFLRGAQKALAGGDFSPIVFSHDNADEEADSLRRCLDRRVDALVVNVAVGADGKTNAPQYRQLIERGIPVVEVFGRFIPEAPNANVDNVAAGRDATQHLLTLGHRRIAMLTHARYDTTKGLGAGTHFDAWRRFLGYGEALDAAGLEPIVITHPLTDQQDDRNVAEQFFRGGERALDTLLDHKTKPTAVVCYSDFQAYGLVRAARTRQLDIPKQLSVVGYGDSDLAPLVDPALTTLRIPAWQIGRRATQFAMEMIEDSQLGESALVSSELKVRGSTVSLDERVNE